MEIKQVLTTIKTIENRYNKVDAQQGLSLIMRWRRDPAEAKDIIQTYFVIHETYEEEPSWNKMEFVTPESIRSYKGPKAVQQIDFSSERESLATLMKPFLEGRYTIPEGRKLKKTDIGRFGRLSETGVKNFSRSLNPEDSRSAKDEYAFICAMYFGVSPFEARMIFHKCVETEELEGYPYVGGALYLLLENKIYDYDTFIDLSCKAMIMANIPLSKVFRDNKYWEEHYKHLAETKIQWL